MIRVMETAAAKFPCMYISHGGGPMPLLGSQPEVVTSLRQAVSMLPSKPNAIVCISAHYISSEGFAVTSMQSPKMIFDYGGFPKESYSYKYNAPGSPDLASEISSRINAAGLRCTLDNSHGFDHGVFVPLMIMFPGADIPVVVLSLNRKYDPYEHIQVGKALSSLRDRGVLFVGSGGSFHNFEYFFANNANKKRAGVAHSIEWNQWLTETLTSPEISIAERERRLVDWTTAPSGIDCQPMGGQDHLLPLHTVFGVAHGAISEGSDSCGTTPQSRCVKIEMGNEEGGGDLVSSSFVWS